MDPGILLAAGVALATWLALRRLSFMGGPGADAGDWLPGFRAAKLEDVAKDSDAVTGWVGKHRVLLTEYIPREGEVAVRIGIQGDSGLTLGRETLGAAFEKGLGAREIEIGDKAFDQEFSVRGSPGVARALLDAGAREQLRPLLRGWIRVDGIANQGVEACVSIRNGELEANVRKQWVDALRTDLPAVLAALLAVARCLERPSDIPSRIAANTRVEPVEGVRLQNLLFLAESHPDHPATREALSHGCQADSPEVRLQSAIALKDAGRDVLMEMASSGSESDAFAVRALAGLGEHVPVERAQALFKGALSTGRVEMACACLGSLGRAGGPEAVAFLAKVLEDERGELAAAAARALGTSGAGAAEAPLVQALDRASAEIRAAAVEALGRLGSAAAVPFLEEAAARENADGWLRRAVRQAIGEIQSRLHGASPGQLSLAASEGGALSLAEEDPAGRVSLVKATEKGES